MQVFLARLFTLSERLASTGHVFYRNGRIRKGCLHNVGAGSMPRLAWLSQSRDSQCFIPPWYEVCLSGSITSGP